MPSPEDTVPLPPVFPGTIKFGGGWGATGCPPACCASFVAATGLSSCGSWHGINSLLQHSLVVRPWVLVLPTPTFEIISLHVTGEVVFASFAAAGSTSKRRNSNPLQYDQMVSHARAHERISGASKTARPIQIFGMVLLVFSDWGVDVQKPFPTLTKRGIRSSAVGCGSFQTVQSWSKARGSGQSTEMMREVVLQKSVLVTVVDYWLSTTTTDLFCIKNQDLGIADPWKLD